MVKAKKILIAPLDWGLGHTTRCIPIIHHLCALKQVVYFAGNDKQINVIKKHFPYITYLHLNGYNITYGSNKILFMPKMVLQIPKIWKAINTEKKWLHHQQSLHQFDIIIADNRYGFNHENALNVFLTHQINVITGTLLGDKIVQRIITNWMRKFQHIWIIDDNNNKLAGKLSKTNHQIPYNYIGWLSQFQIATQANLFDIPYENYILAIISGPEPSRNHLEQLLLSQMAMLTQQHFIIVGGNVNGKNIHTPKHIKYYAFADTPYLNKLIKNAQLVIARSGFSTVMDLVALQKNAVFIPTPGQTEQIYLAKHLMQQQLFFSMQQHLFDLSTALKAQVAYNNNLSFQSKIIPSLYHLIDSNF